MIFTSYFANLRNISDNLVTPISIVRQPPSWYTGLEYTKLAPPWDILNEYRHTKDAKVYFKNYTEQVLDHLDPFVVRQELINIAEDSQIVLLCFERPENFCHRHIVSDWFSSYGIPSQEMNLNGFRSRNLT